MAYGLWKNGEEDAKHILVWTQLLRDIRPLILHLVYTLLPHFQPIILLMEGSGVHRAANLKCVCSSYPVYELTGLESRYMPTCLSQVPSQLRFWLLSLGQDQE